MRHIGYAVEPVGTEHVGVSGHPFDHDDFNALLKQSPEPFPDSCTRWGRTTSCLRKACWPSKTR
ncbi:hypothetical protein [Streptomyces sp. WELS2]|uniref:hypothetical protein n=1 Tax=Streptomyces sp. WELS2 TaxID=2749435 RepID=UPI00215D8F9E|nr:hypothetical protein [Streptomyces sp. WELS2]